MFLFFEKKKIRQSEPILIFEILNYFLVIKFYFVHIEIKRCLRSKVYGDKIVERRLKRTNIYKLISKKRNQIHPIENEENL